MRRPTRAEVACKLPTLGAFEFRTSLIGFIGTTYVLVTGPHHCSRSNKIILFKRVRTTYPHDTICNNTSSANKYFVQLCASAITASDDVIMYRAYAIQIGDANCNHHHNTPLSHTLRGPVKLSHTVACSIVGSHTDKAKHRLQSSLMGPIRKSLAWRVTSNYIISNRGHRTWIDCSLFDY